MAAGSLQDRWTVRPILAIVRAARPAIGPQEG
jgi:hypothetical protein